MQMRYHELNNNITGINNDIFKKFTQFINYLNKINFSTLKVISILIYEIFSIFILIDNILNILSLNVLFHWSWINKNIMNSIILDEFDIHLFSKFHHEHTFHNHHLKSIKESYNIPLDDFRLKFIIDHIKVHQIFWDLSIFLNIWLIYFSIHINFAIKYDFDLISWIKCLIQKSLIEFSWSIILNYIIIYYIKYQKSVSDIWFIIDHEIISDYFILIIPRSIYTSILNNSPYNQNQSKKNITSIQE